MNPVIAFLSDFGTKDIYVGVMKGAVQRICPQAHLIDITHAIQPQSVRQAAFALLNAYGYFAEGTIFVAVVDPGVGTTRRPLAVRAGGYTFVAPDNGLLTYVLSQSDDAQIVELTNSTYWLPVISNTFHGRDIFAPVAAHLAAGVPLEDFGSPLDSIFALPAPLLEVVDKQVAGEVMHIDQFGNIVTSIGAMRWVTPDRLVLNPRFGEARSRSLPMFASNASVTIHNQVINTILPAYNDAARGHLLALIGSSGYLEIAMNQGNAASRLDARIGDRVEIQVGAIDGAIRD